MSHNEHQTSDIGSVGALVDEYVFPYMNPTLNMRGFPGSPTYEDGAFKLAGVELNFDSSGNFLTVGTKTYEVTRGLLELIFKKNPKDFETSDLENYKSIYDTICIEWKIMKTLRLFSTFHVNGSL